MRGFVELSKYQALRDERDALAEEVAYFKREIRLAAHAAPIIAVRERFRLTPMQARMLVALYQAPAHTLSRAQLSAAAPGPNDEDREIKIIDVCISKIRSTIGKHHIETVWGHGYRLSPSGIAFVGSVITVAA